MKTNVYICVVILVLSASGPVISDNQRISKIDSTLGFLITLYEEDVKVNERSPLFSVLNKIEETNAIDVSIRADHILSAWEIKEFQDLGVQFCTVNGEIAQVGRIYGARVPVHVIWKLADEKSVQFIESVWSPAVNAPLDVSIPNVNADTVWGLTDLNGRNITGQQVTIANFDTGIDVFHPDFWLQNGSTYSWIDTTGNSAFNPGADHVDLNGNGIGEPNEILDFFDAQGTAGNNDGIYQVDTDWLYNDSNTNGSRDYGLLAGYTESHPTYGELLFLVNDTNGNNTLDPGETIQALGTSKVAMTLNLGGFIRMRGVDLIQTDADTNGHGTGVAGILGGGSIGRKYVGVAPDATVLSADRISNSYTVYIPWAASNGADIMLYEFGGWVQHFMDGSSNLEQMINTQAANGIVQVVPAGNLASSNKHSQTVVPGGGATPLPFNVPVTAPNIQTVYISVLWQTPANNLSFNLASPGASVAFPGTTPGWQFVIMADGHTVWYNRVTSSRGTARYDFVIVLNPVAAGGWTLTVNNGGGAELIDGYIADNVTSWSGGAVWTALTTDQQTITWPGTADAAITVASYSTRSRLGTVPVGDLSLFSGRGTRIDGTSIMDIAAPGNYDVICAESKDVGANLVGKYQWFGGTSAAGPHVAGAAALLLQNKPWLGHNMVKTIIQMTARTDGFTGVCPNDNWGYGKLDCLGAILYNNAPTVTVLYPNGGEIVAGTCAIQWTASDPDGDPLTVDIEYSDDNGVTWYPIIMGTGNTGSYPWDTNSVSQGTQYLIRITVYDGFGGTAQDQSDGVFAVIPSAAGGGGENFNTSRVYEKWVGTLAENRIKKAESLKNEAYNYLEKVKEKEIDTSEVEPLLKEADNLLEKAKIVLDHNPIPANNLAIKAIELYGIALDKLKELLEDP
jgi:subtilisin family serine protease